MRTFLLIANFVGFVGLVALIRIEWRHADLIPLLFAAGYIVTMLLNLAYINATPAPPFHRWTRFKKAWNESATEPLPEVQASPKDEGQT